MILSLPQLTLREFQRRDWEAVHAYANDPEVVRYLWWGPNTERDSRTFVQHAIGCQLDQTRREFDFAIVANVDGTLVGACRVHIVSPEDHLGSIGYCLRRSAWGKGYATEAARALLDFGFGELGLHRIAAVCDPANLPSVRVLEKIGMKREGHLRQHRWLKGHWRDSLLYAVLAPEHPRAS